MQAIFIEQTQLFFCFGNFSVSNIGTILARNLALMETFWSHLGSMWMALRGVSRCLEGFRMVVAQSVKLFEFPWCCILFRDLVGALREHFRALVSLLRAS